MQQITKTVQVLLIEDSITDAIMLERTLNRMNATEFELQRAESLQQGLDFMSQAEFDVILLDLSLPDSWGLRSLNKIQEITREIPIIVLTGTDSDELAIAAVRGGAQDYIVKSHSINTEVFSLLLKRGISHAIERKHINQQLSHSEALYRGAIEDRTDFICRFLPNGEIFFVNQAFARYLGEDSDKFYQRNFFLAVTREDSASVSSIVKNLREHHPLAELEFRAYSQGELVWQQWTIRAIFQNGEAVEYQAIGQDISDLKAAEKDKVKLIASLHESKERFRVVTNSAPVLIWMSDAKGKAVFINQYWLDFTGKTLEEALLENWLVGVHPEDISYCQITYRDALQNRESFNLEYRFLDAKGKYRWILYRGVPRFTDKGQFAGMVCSGIDISQRKKAEMMLTQQAERNYILAEITRSIHESLELEKIIVTATRKVHNFLRVEAVLISKLEDSGELTILSEHSQTQSQSCSVSAIDRSRIVLQGCNLNFLRGGKTLLFNPHKQPSQESTEKQQNIQRLSKEATNLQCSALSIPIIVERKLWGVFSVEECSQPRTWQTQEIELLEQIALQLAIAIKQAELYRALETANQQLKELAVIDSLTGIANRRKFDEYIEAEWKRLAREQGMLCLILCDIDYFKLYNDTYGHQKGDRCLQKVAQAIKKTIKRPADLTARYGGEEIAIVLPNTSLEGAEKLARDVCRRIKALQIPHINSGADMYVTLSLGVAGCVPQLNSSAADLITLADENLYKAKEQGRNRVVV